MKTKKKLYGAALAMMCGLLPAAATLEAQTLLVGELQSGTITEITPQGVVSTFDSGLNHPSSLAFDRHGNLYEADYWSGHVYEFSALGYDDSFVYLPDCFALAFDSSDNLYIGDTVNGTITKVTQSGLQSQFAAGLKSISSMAFNTAGDLFVGDFSGNITEITPSGVQSTFASGFAPRDGLALAFSDIGILFVGEEDNNNVGYGNITEITPDGTESTFLSGLSFSPQALAFDNMGNLFVAGYSVGNVYKITPDGTVTTFASGLGGSNPATLAFVDQFLPVQHVPRMQTAVFNGKFQLGISSAYPYYATVVQASTDLVNWYPVYTNTPPFVFTDSITGNPGRYYRAVMTANSP